MAVDGAINLSDNVYILIGGNRYKQLKYTDAHGC